MDPVSREAWDERWDGHRREHGMETVARDVARTAVERRLQEMNALREQIDRERGLFVERATYDSKHEALTTLLSSRIETLNTKVDDRLEALALRLAALENARANIEGRVWAIGATLGTVVVLIEVALRLVRI